MLRTCGKFSARSDDLVYIECYLLFLISFKPPPTHYYVGAQCAEKQDLSLI